VIERDPFHLLGRLVKRDRRPRARVYEVVKVAGMYVRIGATDKHSMGSKRPDYTAKWYLFERLIEVNEE